MNNKEVKVTVMIPEEIINSAREIAKSENVSVTHVIRRALKTEQFIKNAERAGKKILIEGADGKTIQRLVRI